MANKARRDMRVAVLAGGISDEREISLASGGNVMNALREAGYGVVELIDPSSPTSWPKWQRAAGTSLSLRSTAVAVRTA